jgi:hypothetical protein
MENKIKKIITGGKPENISETLGGRLIKRYKVGGIKREDDDIDDLHDYTDYDINENIKNLDNYNINLYDKYERDDFPYILKNDERVDINESKIKTIENRLNSYSYLRSNKNTRIKENNYMNSKTKYGGNNVDKITNNISNNIDLDHSIEIIDNRIIKFMTELESLKKYNSKYLPFDKNDNIYKYKQFIKNIVLTLLRESNATHLINDIFTEEKYHCPRRLYYWITNTWLTDLIKKCKDKNSNFDENKIEKLPIFPEYKPTIAFYDEGLYDVLLDIKDMCINIEKYYSIVYEYIFKYQKLLHEK